MVFCENLRFPNALFSSKGENLQKSATISENLRLGSVCPLRFVPLSAPWSKLYCHGVSHEKKAFFRRFSSLPPVHPPLLKDSKFIFIVASPSLKTGGFPPFFRERPGLCRGPIRDCASQVLLIGRGRGKGPIGKIPGQKSSKSQKKAWKSQKGRKRRTSTGLENPCLPAFDIWCLFLWGLSKWSRDMLQNGVSQWFANVN